MNKTMNFILCTLAMMPCLGMLNGNTDTLCLNVIAFLYALVLYHLTKTKHGRKIVKTFVKTNIELINK